MRPPPARVPSDDLALRFPGVIPPPEGLEGDPGTAMGAKEAKATETAATTAAKIVV